VPRQTSWSGGAQSQTEEALKSNKILLIRIDFYIGDKIGTFCSSTLGVGKIAGIWGQIPQPPEGGSAPRSLRSGLKADLPEFSKFYIFVFMIWFKFLLQNMILNYCRYIGVSLNSAQVLGCPPYLYPPTVKNNKQIFFVIKYNLVIS